MHDDSLFDANYFLADILQIINYNVLLVLPNSLVWIEREATQNKFEFDGFRTAEMSQNVLYDDRNIINRGIY